ncbi:undecaprenyldiphospho-muramoylpentapeptide beta-N-acetylglucosaminyltransferase [Brochothrix campestris]|uniref:UDP-N-acetylglucosamine--N-acetylmuramyl-(pentapeptide) pyrophosphoryl-undecaprenol N-acetylglucosamine transferase n=1 Tax=Brochothrix campestris FSL F6-1037 TaxID=1265861 RepID=W7D179_9LIST|nr:undecaprenyldiphospho-muramoylpentapeptide beta-N-acetylglucosaminyltransferase [Brochothrix campestris]EUJ41736.1 undecaprenyldiphospho-muramoylpentapeptide beta-N- acetylglucosaminyltransferase [Brochothrix campestris FSL F6-1037]
MKLLISGGGTGGHIYPALALVRQFKENYPDGEVLYVGTSKGLEADIVPRAGIAFETMEITGFKRKLSLENIKTIARFMKGVSRAKQIIKEFKPDVVVGTGGYVCAPVVYAAAKKNIPTVIHEQNSVAGLTNKFLSRYVDKIAVAFEAVMADFPTEKVTLIGNPRATEVVQAENNPAVLSEYGLDLTKKTALIFGGSRGARALNEAIIEALPTLAQKDYQVLCATGDIHFAQIEAAAKAINASNVKIVPFIYNMPAVLRNCDVVVSRAGATSLAEFTALGLPSILIPSPYVTNNHQEKNAMALVEKGAAEMIKQTDLSAAKLVEQLDHCLLDETYQAKMKAAALALGKPQAAQDLCDLVTDLAK